MKRETKEWLAALSPVRPVAKDALDSDARQRAEIRDLKKVIRGIAKAIDTKPELVDLPTIRLWVAIGLKPNGKAKR